MNETDVLTTLTCSKVQISAAICTVEVNFDNTPRRKDFKRVLCFKKKKIFWLKNVRAWLYKTALLFFNIKNFINMKFTIVFWDHQA